MLDLTKLRAAELPSKEIEVVILGEKQNVRIFAPNDVAAMRIGMLAPKADDPDVSLQIQREALKAFCPDLSDDDVALLMERAIDVVQQIVLAGQDLAVEWRKSRNAVVEQAEKNSIPATSTNVTA